MAEFAGEGRIALRDRLLARMARISADGSGGLHAPRIIVLQAPSGAGKSRIVREFYRELRKPHALARTHVRNPVAVAHPQYWPDLTDPMPAGKGVPSATVANRKVLGPPVQGFAWEPKALPTFFWWSVNCEQLSTGQIVDARAQLEQAMRWHGPAMLMAWRDMVALDTRTRAEVLRVVEGMRASVRGDRSGTALDAADIVTSIANLSLIPGLGPITKALVAVYRRVVDERHLRTSVDERIILGERPEDAGNAAGRMAERVSALTLPGLPAVVAIEDAHLMGPDLALLLDQLSRPIVGHPVMAVCTAWWGHDTDSSYGAWLARGLAEGRVELWSLDELETGALRSIVDTYVPGTREELKQRLVRQWSNPLCLELFLTWEELADSLIPTSDGLALDLTAEELESKPDTIPELYRARWKGLREPVRSALLATAGCLPPGDPMQPFTADVIAAVVAADPRLVSWAVDAQSAGGVVTESLEQAREGNWTIRQQWGDAFRETDLADVVMSSARSVPVRKRMALRAAVVSELCLRINAFRGDCYVIDGGQPEVLLAARWLVGLDPDSPGAQLPLAVARVSLARREGDGWQYERALRILERDVTLAALDPGSRQTLAIRADEAAWTGEAGKVEEARTAYATLVDDCARLLGSTDRFTLVARRGMAHWTGICEQRERALALYLVLVADCAAAPDAADVLRVARGGLALWTGECGDCAAAVAQFAALVGACATAVGERHPETLEARRGQARWTGEGGDSEGARRLYEVLSADCVGWFGPLDPQSFEARRGFARWTLESNHPQDALPLYEAVVADCTRVYGPRHILTLWARHGLAQAVGECGDAVTAREMARAVHADSSLALSPQHRLIGQSQVRFDAWARIAGAGS
jgi:hypothetical protein